MAAKSKVLALEGTAHGQGTGWRKGEDLIDALPYIDALAPELKKQVDQLIEEEIKKSTKKPSDYLREMPAMPQSSFDAHPILAAELERIKNKQPMAPLDTTRYRLDAPQGTKRHDFGAWRSSVDNAYSQLEHQYLRIMNLELMLKYGDKNWRAQGQLVDSLVKHYETELAETKKQITAVNMERKLQQTAAGQELRKAEQEYYGMLHKNVDIELACDRLEQEIYEMKSGLEKLASAKEAAPAPQPGPDAPQPGPDAPQPPQPGPDAPQPGPDAPQPGPDAPQQGPDAPQQGADVMQVE